MTVKLANGGKALFPVVVAEKVTAETKANAAKLADYLGRIAGTKFAVETGEGYYVQKLLDFMDSDMVAGLVGPGSGTRRLPSPDRCDSHK